MPRIKKAIREKEASPNTWQQTIADRVRAGKALPIISNLAYERLVFDAETSLVDAYADYIGYPDTEKRPLAYLTQFRKITDDSLIDTQSLKVDYINFLKNKLYDIAEADGVDEDILEEVEEEFDDINFSEIANRLGYPKFDEGSIDPLLIFANLPLPIYLTTGYHDFMEVVLRRLGKSPRTEICRWHSGLEMVPSVFDDDYEPSVQEPLVYHLHGQDKYPDSLVLTEDDHLDWLVDISQNVGGGEDHIPRRVRQAMAESSLLLLGYNIEDLEFLGLFWGLIEPRPRQPLSVFQSLAPDDSDDVLKAYLRRYLGSAEMRIYWGDIRQYAAELQQGLEELMR